MKIISLILVSLFSFSLFAHDHRHGDHQKRYYESQNSNSERRERDIEYHHQRHHGKKHHHLHDGQIAYILSKANKAEVEVADSIKHRLKNSEVKGFAKMMMKDHSAAEKKACKVLDKEGILKSPNKWGLKLDKKKEMLVYHLQQYSRGVSLDRAYMKSQIKMHEMMLEALDEKFIPQAENEAFKMSLYEKRASVVHHLEVAKDIASRIP